MFEKFTPFHYPLAVSRVIQPLARKILLGVANYQVKINQELPTEPTILVAYPHGEHANSLLLPPNEVGYLAAADYWFQNVFLRWAIANVVDVVPISRGEQFSREEFDREILHMKRLMKRNKHLLVYSQGSRLGPAESEKELQEQLKKGVLLMGRLLNVSSITPVGFVYPREYQPAKGGVSAWKRLRSGDRSPVHIEVNIGDAIPVPGAPKGDPAAMKRLAQSLYALAQPR